MRNGVFEAIIEAIKGANEKKNAKKVCDCEICQVTKQATNLVEDIVRKNIENNSKFFKITVDKFKALNEISNMMGAGNMNSPTRIQIQKELVSDAENNLHDAIKKYTASKMTLEVLIRGK